MKNLRITFWGVQGSCPIFLSQHEFEEYAKHVATFTLTRSFEELAQLEPSAKRPLEQLLGGPATRDAILAYQARLGLPELPIYGGDTTCVEVETSEGNILIFDGGSGVRQCSNSIVERWADRKDRTLYIFGSHEHLDHRSGLPFATFCFLKENPFKLRVYGHYNFLKALDDRFGVFSEKLGELTYQDDPLDFKLMSAEFRGFEIRDPTAEAAGPGARHWEVHDLATPVRIGRTEIFAFSVFHGPTPCLGYKVCHDGVSFVFCTDHECRQGFDPTQRQQVLARIGEENLIRFSRGVDAMYIDGQFFKAEYMGLRGIGKSPAVSRMDWGHGVIETNIERAFLHKIKRTYIGHHDPGREWPERLQVDRELEYLCRDWDIHIELAKGGSSVEI